MNDCQIVILAGGKGSRMGSHLPKVMHEIAGKPMLDRVIINANQVCNDLVLVISPQVAKHIHPYQSIKQIIQNEAKGTGHATFVALPHLNSKKYIAVLCADNPLISPKIINALINKLKTSNAAIVTLAFERKDPNSYGRIILDENNNFVKIVEFKEATEEEKKVTLCNSGITAFAPTILNQYLTKEFVESHDRDKEIYLTELLGILYDAGEKVEFLISENPDHAIGVNTKQDLLDANLNFNKYNYNL